MPEVRSPGAPVVPQSEHLFSVPAETTCALPASPPAPARAIARGAPDYPAAFESLRDPPPMLYVRGALPALRLAVAVVGSRAASPYGMTQAARLAADLAGLGVVVVSGLARGIDAAAHRGALEAGGVTVAILPGGLDAITPVHHRALADEIATRGALVSEMASGPPAKPGLFVRRNRLIAALAAATVVVEADTRSGALSTAKVAVDLGRKLFAFPGDVDRPTSRGCHALIRGGATLCASAGDVMRAIGIASTPDEASGLAVRVLAALAQAPERAEALARRVDAPLDRVLAALTRLEWSSLVQRHPGARFSRVKGSSR